MCTYMCYFTGIFYAVVRQMSMLFIDNKDYVFCIQSHKPAFSHISRNSTNEIIYHNFCFVFVFVFLFFSVIKTCSFAQREEIQY